MKIDKPGQYRTSDGRRAVVDAVGGNAAYGWVLSESEKASQGSTLVRWDRNGVGFYYRSMECAPDIVSEWDRPPITGKYSWDEMISALSGIDPMRATAVRIDLDARMFAHAVALQVVCGRRAGDRPIIFGVPVSQWDANGWAIVTEPTRSPEPKPRTPFTLERFRHSRSGGHW